jgi:hypothetical protein
MGKIEEKVACQYCGKEISKAGIANHEKACPENPKNKVIDDTTVETPETLEVAPVVQIVTEPVKKLVEVRMKESIECYIGDRYYRLAKGKVELVTPEVKERLKNADLLDAL